MVSLTCAYTEALNGLIKIANRAGRGYSFETIRAKALLSEPYTGTLCQCPVCKGHTRIKPKALGIIDAIPR